jgi:hypothetical protein
MKFQQLELCLLCRERVEDCECHTTAEDSGLAALFDEGIHDMETVIGSDRRSVQHCRGTYDCPLCGFKTDSALCEH